MNFPWTRHLQRYEYPSQKGYVYKKQVLDAGCGTMFGAYRLSTQATLVYAVDLNHIHIERALAKRILADSRPERVVPLNINIYDFHQKVDVCVAIEFIEHLEDPHRFIEHISNLCTHLFLTTPVVEFTRVTRNPNHVKEYSERDLQKIISEKFDILDVVYQLPTMEITREANAGEDSLEIGHVVQMLWCRKSENGE